MLVVDAIWLRHPVVCATACRVHKVGVSKCMSDAEEEVGPSSCSLLAGLVFSTNDTPRVFDSMRMVLILGGVHIHKCLHIFCFAIKENKVRSRRPLVQAHTIRMQCGL